MAVLLSAAALAAPPVAAASVTLEDRAFAHAFERFDASVGALTADPALVAALRARQQAGAACVDAAHAATGANAAASFDAFLFYYLYVADPFLDAAVRADAVYIRALKRMHLHDPTLRSARAVLILLNDVRPPSDDVFADFCGPLRAWQAAGFAKGSAPAQIKATSDFVERIPTHTARRHKTLRRAVARMRAAGMPRAAREHLADGGADLDLDKLLRGDAVLAAFGAS